MKKLISILLVLIMSCTVLAGCKKNSQQPVTPTDNPSQSTLPESKTDEPASQEPISQAPVGKDVISDAEKNKPPEGAKLKNVLRIGTTHTPDAVDPHMSVDNPRVVFSVYSGLLDRTPEGVLIPDLATDWKVNEAGTVWTFHLRKDVKWHDGTPFTAEDVKATFDRVTNPEAPKTATSKLSFIKETRVIDPYTVEIETEGPFAPMLATLTPYFARILSKKYIEKYGDDLGKTAESVCGTGPFKMASYKWGEEVILTANEDYYKPGIPYIKELHIVVIPEAIARTAALQNGEVDLITHPNVSDIPMMKENKDLVVSYNPSICQFFFMYNCSEKSILHDPRLRQAINYCVDRQAIIDVLLADLGAENPRSVLEKDSGSADFGIIEQDYDKARALMADAGYPNGFDVKLFASDQYIKNVAQAEMIKAMCAEVGINIDIHVGDHAEFNTLFGITPEKLEYDIFCMGHGSGSGDLDELRGLYTTSDDGYNDENYGFYSNAEVDRLLAKQAITIDVDERQELLNRVQEIMYLEDPFALLIYNSMDVLVFNKNVQNFSMNTIMKVFYDFIWVLDE